VILISKTARLESGSSFLAQGGIAAAVGHEDSPQAHAADTELAGAGLCNSERVLELTKDAGAAVQWLLDEGIQFDRDLSGELQLAREGAHQHARVVHAGGDATGNVLMSHLAHRVAESPSITVLNATFVGDLLCSGGQVVGVVAFNASRGWTEITAPHVVLATGGIGMVWEHTTNPAESTGDGLAMAARAGAKLANMEFMQFHPTALGVSAGRGNLTLLTEALRGAGATLLEDSGNRFMRDIDVAAELAPRDVIARAIHERVSRGHQVFLDIAPALQNRGAKAFPNAIAAAQQAGFDPYRDPIPVVPAAHYHMGGVQVDAMGQSSLAGLWACGEVSTTGIHGANRLASNSLLEAVVYARRVAQGIRSSSNKLIEATTPAQLPEPIHLRDVNLNNTVAMIRRLMARRVGITRNEDDLRAAIARLDNACPELAGIPGEISNLLLVARLVALAALRRKESRGAHYRHDYPLPVPGLQYAQYLTVDALLETI
jgi:L-aspartate oxidase